VRPTACGLRTLSDGVTTIDGQPVGKGVDVPVRSGTRIGVANTLTLRLAGPAHAAAGRRGQPDDGDQSRFGELTACRKAPPFGWQDLSAWRGTVLASPSR
jgi:hypothetical protein